MNGVQVMVRPMEANLTHDTETFGLMVLLIQCRVHTSKSTWVGSTTGPQPLNMQGKTPIGMTT